MGKNMSEQLINLSAKDTGFYQDRENELSYVYELQKFYADLKSERGQDSRIIKASKEREEFLYVIDRKKLSSPMAVVVEMHDDDRAIAGGIVRKLVKAGIGVINITVTKGDGRPRGEIPPQEVAKRRREEGVKAAKIMGLVAYIHLGFEDLHVGREQEVITATLTQYFRMFDPDAVLTTHKKDINPDHKRAKRVVEDALYAGRNAVDLVLNIPYSTKNPPAALYFMETQTLFNSHEKPVKMDMFVPILPDERKTVKEALLAIETQYPNPEAIIVFEKRAHELGKLIGRPDVEALSHHRSGMFTSEKNIIGNWLGGNNFHERPNIPHYKKKVKKIKPVREQ